MPLYSRAIIIASDSIFLRGIRVGGSASKYVMKSSAFCNVKISILSFWPVNSTVGLQTGKEGVLDMLMS